MHNQCKNCKIAMNSCRRPQCELERSQGTICMHTHPFVLFSYISDKLMIYLPLNGGKQKWLASTISFSISMITNFILYKSWCHLSHFTNIKSTSIQKTNTARDTVAPSFKMALQYLELYCKRFARIHIVLIQDLSFDSLFCSLPFSPTNTMDWVYKCCLVRRGVSKIENQKRGLESRLYGFLQIVCLCFECRGRHLKIGESIFAMTLACRFVQIQVDSRKIECVTHYTGHCTACNNNPN